MIVTNVIRQLSAVQAAFAVAVPLLLLLLLQVVKRASENRRIRALGGHAALRPSYLPWGLDIAYEHIWFTKNCLDAELWLSVFRRWGRPQNPYTVEFRVAGDRFVFTADPENIKAVLATQFADFGKGDRFNLEWKAFLGNSIFTTDGDRWHHSRQLIRPQFIKDRVSDLDTFERHFQVLLALLKPGETVDIADIFFRFTLDAATDFLFGRSVDSLQNPQVKFADAFQKVQHIQSLISRAGKLRWLVTPREYYTNIGLINDFVDPFIDATLQLTADELQQRTKTDHGYTFLHALAGFTRDRAVLRDQLVAVLLASRDTTASTLSWLFHELSRHPHVLAKLRREIAHTLDGDAAAAVDDGNESAATVDRRRRPTYVDLKAMPYLQHTLNETLRLYPAIPYNLRIALRDASLPRGGGSDGNAPVGVPRGTRVAYTTQLMQRRADLHPPPTAGFPPVDVFEPDRWDSWTPKNWTYIPFNGGPRICVGQQFALAEMGYVTVRLLQHFERVEARGDGHPPMLADIVLSPKGGVPVAFF